MSAVQSDRTLQLARPMSVDGVPEDWLLEHDELIRHGEITIRRLQAIVDAGAEASRPSSPSSLQPPSRSSTRGGPSSTEATPPTRTVRRRPLSREEDREERTEARRPWSLDLRRSESDEDDDDEDGKAWHFERARPADERRHAALAAKRRIRSMASEARRWRVMDLPETHQNLLHWSTAVRLARESRRPPPALPRQFRMEPRHPTISRAEARARVSRRDTAWGDADGEDWEAQVNEDFRALRRRDEPSDVDPSAIDRIDPRITALALEKGCHVDHGRGDWSTPTPMPVMRKMERRRDVWTPDE